MKITLPLNERSRIVTNPLRPGATVTIEQSRPGAMPAVKGDCHDFYSAAGKIVTRGWRHIVRDDFQVWRSPASGSNSSTATLRAIRSFILILTPLQKNLLETMLRDTDNKSLLVEDHLHPILCFYKDQGETVPASRRTDLKDQ